MLSNDFILKDRIEKIRSVITEYGEYNFYISFSGGKDSCVISKLVDIAVPHNRIPRVYCNTGIEYKLIVDFVEKIKSNDNRFEIIKPNKNIKETLDIYGYPFKSKEHSEYVDRYQHMGESSKTYQRYMFPDETRKRYGCPKCLRYQFTHDFNIKISRKCCEKLKKEPFKIYKKLNNKKYTITGMRTAEGGSRINLGCIQGTKFNPLIVVSDEWEEWFIKQYDVEICDIYKEPYNFKRTGCKGCPYNLNLQKDLDTLEKYFPGERKQCEYIWKPVYDEYRRLGYRLRKE